MKSRRQPSLRAPRRTPLRAPQRSRPVGTWSLLVVDSQRIRTKAQKDYHKATRDLETARAETERFHSEDKPLFSRWMSANFGALLTEMRELQAKLIEAQDLVNEVQQEYFYGGHASVAEAYRKVLHRRAHPEEAPAEDSTVDPEEDAEFEREFEEATREAAEDFWSQLNGAQAGFSDPPPPRAQSHRLKELYRKLARRLHPDNGRKITPRETELWHKTQAAYDSGQVEVLETIWSLLDVDENGTKTAPISTLLQLTAELKKTVRALKRELTALRRDVAWNFSRRGDHDELRLGAEATLRADRDKLVWLFTKYQSQIDRWNAQAAVNGKRPRARRRTLADEEWF